jgi:hypothetical protein
VADILADSAIAASNPSHRRPQATLFRGAALLSNFAFEAASTLLEACLRLLVRFTGGRSRLGAHLLRRADLAAVLATIADADEAGEVVVMSAAGLLNNLLSTGGHAAAARAAVGEGPLAVTTCWKGQNAVVHVFAGLSQSERAHIRAAQELSWAPCCWLWCKNRIAIAPAQSRPSIRP